MTFIENKNFKIHFSGSNKWIKLLVYFLLFIAPKRDWLDNDTFSFFFLLKLKRKWEIIHFPLKCFILSVNAAAPFVGAVRSLCNRTYSVIAYKQTQLHMNVFVTPHLRFTAFTIYRIHDRSLSQRNGKVVKRLIKNFS